MHSRESAHIRWLPKVLTTINGGNVAGLHAIMVCGTITNGNCTMPLGLVAHTDAT